ncbi:MAG: ZIP family metal transporter [Actinomycetota bacterium]|nr:ZIP family metal transporter [Actinomycetota bacterium]
MNYFLTLNPLAQALLAGIFTWFLTAAGASAIFIKREFSKRSFGFMLGLASGIMLAASYWSLLAPAIEMSEGRGVPAWLPATVGFMTGGLFIGLIDKILPHLHINFPMEMSEGPETSWRRSTLLILAITIHNIPEGLAIGVAFGAYALGDSSASLMAATALALGIGIQNIPEGLAVAAPLRREGMSALKSFWYGQLSAMVEPVASLLGAAAVLLARPVLPYALSFAAGAMIYVVAEELIPEAQSGGYPDLATIGLLFGFIIMMILDVAFG